MLFRIVFVIVAVYLTVFGGPNFRDGAHFYPPLFQYQLEEIFAGRFPLWNPYENLGQPHAANPTSMLFYPGFYITAVPSIFAWLAGAVPFRTADLYYISCGYNLFLAVHLLLALWTSYRFARMWNCSCNASTLAAVCYTLSGSILFQWNNAPFLVAAALFPEAMRTVIRLLQKPEIKYAVRYAVLLTLMTTGGDPQSAYHSVLCAAVFFAFRPSVWSGFLLFPFAGVLTFLLSAILLLPAMELSRLSDRSLPEFEQYVYWFSVPPQRLLELCFPNIGGRQFPIHTRWFDALPENGIWTPSLYIGMVPMILAIIGIHNSRKPKGCGTMNTAAIILLTIFILGSLGNWFFVYPAMRYLPLYDSFRYPGKLMAAATLFLALFAAIGADWVFCKDAEKRKNRWTLLMKIYAAAAVIMSFIILLIIYLPRNVPANVLFGPFDEAKSNFLFSQTILYVWLFYLCVLGVTDYRKNRLNVLVFLVLADLFVHNHWFFTASKISPPEQRSAVFTQIDGIETAPVRIYRFPHWEPQYFKEHSSSDRVAEAAQWNSETLMPKHTLPSCLTVVDVRGTMMPKEYYCFTQKLRSGLYDDAGQISASPDFIERLERIGTACIIAPKNVKLDAEEILLRGFAPPDVSLWKLTNPAKRNFTVYEPNRIEFEVVLEKPETVVITEQYWNGWRAFDNGKETPVKCVDKIFRAVDLPVGKHHVVMIYDPPLFKIGMALSIIGCILVLITRTFRQMLSERLYSKFRNRLS
ncbi:MAG: YfhO family protein [Planctomycetaceae bacterium]|nr:YfhO family protein [Planctomycetaceae bacterium]